MPTPTVFHPPRRQGISFHITATVMLLAGSSACLVLALEQQVGIYFVLSLAFSLLFFAPLPLVIYRGYALSQANYSLERDGLRLRWGLRAEDIPLPDIEWVRPASDLAYPLPQPRFSWRGALLGQVQVPDLGPVEFMASETQSLLLVATPLRVYAVSPDDPKAFMLAFRRTIEMGSLTPLPSYSTRPAAYLVRIWDDRPARILVTAGAGLTLLLFIIVSLIAAGRSSVSLGFAPDGQPLPPVPAEQMLLLAVLGAFAFIVDLAGGLFFYRLEETRLIGYGVWAASALTPCMLLVGALFML